MKKQYKQFLFLFSVLIFLSNQINGCAFNQKSTFLQKTNFDTLAKKSYKNLKENFYMSGNNFDFAKIYSNAYLDKAKKEKNSEEIANAFVLLCQISNEKESLRYADSVILYANKSNNKTLLIKGNVQKAIQYYFLAEYDNSLIKLLKAQDMAIKEKNEFQQVVIRHYIGNLKNVTNQRKEALKIFRSNLEYFDDKKKLNNEQNRQYLKSLFRLANIYNVLRNLDSAELINRKGIKASFKSENKYMYPLFLACYGSTLQLSGRTDMALDSLQKSASLTNYRKARLASIYLIIAKILYKQENYNKYEKYLLKIDSMYSKYPETIKETKIAYQALINYYRNNMRQEDQLVYMDKLFKVDSLLDFKVKNINKNIARNYESKNTLLEKENIIQSLDKGKKKYFYVVIILILSIFTLLILKTYPFSHSV